MRRAETLTTEILRERFLHRFFESGEESRHERRTKRAELRENGRQEAIKRGKVLDANGKVVNRPKEEE